MRPLTRVDERPVAPVLPGRSATPRSPAPPSPYRRGYTLPGALRPLIADAHKTRPARSLAAALGDHLLGYAAVAVVALATRAGALVAVPAALLATMPVARSLRGLECMVHEASHGNWWRRHRRVNDALAFVLAGVPTGAWIGDYRVGHLLHHGRFGTALDPDLVRYEELDVEGLDRSGRLRMTAGVLRSLPRYQAGWLRTVVAHPVSVAAAPAWCLVAVWLPVRLLAGPSAAAYAAGSWLVALMITLPALRFVAEAGEHVYRGSATVFDATLSNLGLAHRLLLHPHHDGLHTVHHLWPGIPHHALPRVHRALLLADPDGYAARLRHRRTVREAPRTGLAVPRAAA